MKLEDFQKQAHEMVKIDLTGFDDLQQWCSSKCAPEQPAECAILGLCGEAGEYADLKKKELFHQKPCELSEKSKELGDVLFYLCMAARHEGIPMSRIAMD